MNPVLVTQAKGYTAAWAAPEILEGADKITREGDIFAFGMVVIEVCPRASPRLAPQLDGWVICLVSESYFRLLQEGIRSVASGPSQSSQRSRVVNGLLVRGRRKDWV